MKQWELVLFWGGFEIYNKSNIYKTKCFFTFGVSILKEGQTLLARFNSRILRTKRCDRIRIIKIYKKNLHHDTEICKLIQIRLQIHVDFVFTFVAEFRVW